LFASGLIFKLPREYTYQNNNNNNNGLPRISETIKSADFDLLVTVGEAMKQQQIWFYGNHNTDKRPKLDYATLLSKDTGLNLAELGTTMSSRECWWSVVMGSGAPDR